MPPTYDEISGRAGFPVPLSYYEFLRFAFEIEDVNPWNVFEPLGILNFDLSIAHPGYRLTAEDYIEYAGTPAEGVLFAWMGCDGAHFVFLLDETPTAAKELPIARVCFDGCHGLRGMTFSEFLAAELADVVAYQAEHESEHLNARRTERVARQRELIAALVERFSISIPDSGGDDDARHELVWTHRKAAGAIETEDRLGVVLPPNSYDPNRLARQQWRAPDESLLLTAERCLKEGETGSALVLARNFRHHFQYDDWKTDRRWMPWTADILEDAYTRLGRRHAAKKVRAQTDWALKNLL